MQTSKEVKQLSYLSCQKEGLHGDEPLNLICLEAKCADKLLCCCACVETDHKKHSVKPLKYVINEARQNPTNIKMPKMNNDILLDLVSKNRQLSLQIFQTHKKHLIISLQKIQQSITSYYNSIVQQILCNNSDNNLLIDQIILKAINAKNIEDLQKMIQKIVTFLPNYYNPIKGVTEKDVINNISFCSKDMQDFIQATLKDSSNKYGQFQTRIISMTDKNNIWKSSLLSFTAASCHPELSLVSSTRIKSDKNNGYKFAILEPQVQSSNNQTISIKILQSANNWLALGVCHKNILLSKNLGFSFGTIGHGAYLIGANGSSWSHNRADLNNTVKAFKFVTGDIVKISVSMSNKQITFQLGDKFKYQLPFEPITNDPLHACVLFYYKNDEIEYLNNNNQ